MSEDVNEIWKEVVGYEKEYQISNFGRVKSSPKQGNGYKIKIISPYVVGKDRNYLAVRLYKNKQNKQFKVHRLVAEAFIDNTENKPQINHIDGNTFNNYFENLEWVTNSENQIHAHKLGLNYKYKTKKQIEHWDKYKNLGAELSKKPVVQIDIKTGEILHVFESSIKASCYLTNEPHSHIGSVCRGKRKTALGYKWSFLSDIYKGGHIMGKIYCLLGMSSVGKDTLLNLLVDKGFKRVISHTSRPMRTSEINSREYHFVSYDKMLEMKNNKEFVEMRRYYVVNDQVWLYGIHKNEIDLNSNKNYICIVDCDGFESLLSYYGKENVVGIYLYVNAKERLLRSLNRCELTDSDVDEIIRRYEKDKVDFNETTINKCILKLNNINAFESMNAILSYINSDSMNNKDLIVGNKVKITKILDHNKADHLLDFIGYEGFIFSWIIVEGVKRYKVITYKNGEELTSYFRRDELKLIEG